ncbi:MAG: O-methyltransferase [Acholeplasmataceae bacterium]|nr:O-methyltransferase [Acholeplasmataceae bacterium]
MINELKQYAKAHHVPIISDDGLLFLKHIFESQQIKDVLEIGTAIGYSAIVMASWGARIDTFERNKDMIDQAKRHIEISDMKHQVTLIPEDALTYQGILKFYDLIFIDAAKSQYQKFFEKYTPYLNPGGIVICDNLSFHNLKPENVNRHTRQLLKKIDSFKSFLVEHKGFNTEFFTIGDGMSLSKRIAI